MSLLDNLPHTVSWFRPTASTRDNLGATREGTPITLVTGDSDDPNAWIQNASEKEILEFAKIDQVVTHRVFLITFPDLRPNDYAIVDAGPSYVGLRLNFIANPVDRSAGLGVLQRIMTEEENNPRNSTFGNS